MGRLVGSIGSILSDARWIGPHGIGRFAQEVLSRVGGELLDKGPPLLHPLEPLWLSLQLYRRRPQVYFSPGFNPPLASLRPFVFTIHDLIHLRVPQEASLAKQLYYKAVVRPAAHRAYQVLTVSEYSRREILEWAQLPEHRVTVVGNGVSAAYSPEGPRHRPGYPYLLYVGNRKPHKNLGRLFQAFAMSGLARDVRLVLSGPPDAETHNLARSSGITGGVVFAGPIPEEELPAYYRGATALVFPSLYEGFGLPPLEAMASGTPVLTSNTTSLPEVVGDAAVTVDPLDTEQMAVRLQELVEDTALRAVLRERGLERARLFSWEKTAEAVRRVLEAAAGER